MADEKVEFTDTQGRKCLFKLNTSGALDYYIDGKHKASQIKELKPAGNQVGFDGKRIMLSEKEATIPEEESEAVIGKLMDLQNKAHDVGSVDVNVSRCIVQVLRGEGLRAADDCGTSDPYVIVSIPGKAKSGDQTKHINRTLDPVWNEYVEVYDYVRGDALEFNVMDYDYLTSDDWLGCAKISPEQLASKAVDTKLTLVDDGQHGEQGKEVKGKLHVKVWITSGSEVSDELEEAMQAVSGRAPLSKSKTTSLLEDDSMCRKDVIKGLIKALAGDSATRVGSAACRKFAECFGFHGNSAEWDCEFKELSSAMKWGAQGPDLEQFGGWIDEDIAFADDIVLGQVLDELKSRASKPDKRPRYFAFSYDCKEKTLDLMSTRPRESLVEEVFKLLAQGASTLSFAAMHGYAEFCGFDGPEDEWKIEWEELMKEYGFSEAGPDLAKFMRIVDSGEGAACNDNELRELADLLTAGGEGRMPQSLLRSEVWLLHDRTQKARAQQPRRILIQRQFDALDDDGNGFLGSDELRRYAEMAGWKGDDEEWAIHYAEMCNDYNLNPRKGADVKQFEKIVDKKGGQANIEAQDLVELIEDTKMGVTHMRSQIMTDTSSRSSRKSTKASFKRQQSKQYTDKMSRAMSRKKTFVDVSKNYSILRSFGVFLRKKFEDTDDAFAAFSKKPFGRLEKGEFLSKLDALGFQGESDSLFRLLSLGSRFIVKRHIKWAWNLLVAEEIVMARANNRAKLRQRMSTLRFSEDQGQ